MKRVACLVLAVSTALFTFVPAHVSAVPAERAATRPSRDWDPSQGRDRPDDVTGYQVQVVYVLTPSGTDAAYDSSGKIASWVDQVQGWLLRNAGGRLVFDTHDGVLDVPFLRIDFDVRKSEKSDRKLLEIYRSLNRRSPRGKTIVFVVDQTAGAEGYCGYAPRPGSYALVFPGLAGCGENPYFTSVNDGLTYPAHTLVHEVFHSYGVRHVCGDETDLMLGAPECPEQRDPERAVTLDASRTQYLGGAQAGVDVTQLRIWEDGRGVRRPDFGFDRVCWANESCTFMVPRFNEDHQVELQVRVRKTWETVATYRGTYAAGDNYPWRFTISHVFTKPGAVAVRLYVARSERWNAFVGKPQAVRVLP